jgi:hypothetical protein
VKITLSGMQGTIEDSYTIIPQFQGKYPIPSIQFSYFDPKTETYRTQTSQDLIVDVFDGPTAAVQGTYSNGVTSKQVVAATNENAFRFIKLNTTLSPINQQSFWMSYRFWVLLLVPILLLIAAYIVKLFVLDKTEDASSVKQRRAQQLAKKYLSSAKKEFHNQTRFYEALERALHNYLKAKLNIETTELSKSKIESLLFQKKVAKHTALEFVTVVENCEIARYAPGSSVNIQGDYEKASSLIAQIDRQL